MPEGGTRAPGGVRCAIRLGVNERHDRGCKSGPPLARRAVARLAAIIGAPAAQLPTYGRTADGARPHVEFDGRQFHYVVAERGRELERHASADPAEILYRVFDGVTAAMAWAREARHRRPGEDPRRQAFDAQLDLLGRLSPDWRARTRARLDDALRRNPFEDRHATHPVPPPARRLWWRGRLVSAILAHVAASYATGVPYNLWEVTHAPPGTRGGGFVLALSVVSPVAVPLAFLVTLAGAAQDGRWPDVRVVGWLAVYLTAFAAVYNLLRRPAGRGR